MLTVVSLNTGVLAIFSNSLHKKERKTRKHKEEMQSCKKKKKSPKTSIIGIDKNMKKVLALWETQTRRIYF